jgi:RsiW-degrading membrane proteinase PrsW (M82 family)
MSKSSLTKFEESKASAEYLRHLTTLSTGSIVLITVFLEKLFLNPSWKGLVAISLIGFMISVLSSVVAYTIIIEFDWTTEKSTAPKWAKIVGLAGFLFTWLGFLVGITSLSIFALKNLLR